MKSTETTVSQPMKNSTINTLDSAEQLKKKSIGCVIMASGEGKRFGGNKLMATLGNKPMLQWILDTTKDLFDFCVVVTRSIEVQKLCKEQSVEVIFHSEPGRNDTVRLGLAFLEDKVDYCFFVPGDQPFIQRDTFLKFLELIGESDRAYNDEVQNGEIRQYIWRGTYGERVGAPVCFPKWTFGELKNLPVGKGGNVVVKRHEEMVRSIQVFEEIELDDIDTQEDMIKAREYVKGKKENS